jgi:hypothetical protein
MRPNAGQEVACESVEGGRMAVYEIRVKGHLDGRWSEWFDGLAIANVENGDALLSGEIVDQSALHGVLNKVRDLGLPLMAVSRIKSMPEGLRPIKQDDEKGAGKR